MPRFTGLRRRLEVEILEDRLTPAVAIVPTYAVVQDWGTGLQATMRLTNTQATAEPNWKVEFDYSAAITSIWDAQILSRTGNHYVVGSAGWNSTLAGNSSVSFGFNASPGGAIAPPTNYVFAGTPVSSPPPAPVTAVPLAINAGGGAVGTFGSDTKFTGGTIASTASAIITAGVADAAPASVYQSWRQGSFIYTVTGLEAGKSYTVQLHFAENTYTLAGQRTFNVTANSTRLLTNFDVFATAGGRFKALVKTFTVAADSAGKLTLDFTAVKNGAILSGLAVQPANRPPNAVNDAATTSAGKAVTVAVLANDTDPDGNSLTVLANTQGQRGSVTAGAGGTLVYTPAAGFSGADAFTYTISDGRGGTATATVNLTVTAVTPPPAPVSSWPTRVFAPYVDTTLWPTFDFVKAARDQGLRYFTLAFVVANSANQPAWGGFSTYGVVGSDFSAGIKTQITALRALGGDVAVGFGGAAGRELAQVITDVTTLKNAYQSVIDAYGLTHIDFDIEGAALTDRASIDRRFQAIAGLKQTAAAAGKELTISFTLPVLPSGLTADGVALLSAAQRFGVKIDLVNIMAMDYGDSAAPPTAHTMGYYAIQAATSLFGQLRQVMGSTPTDAQLWAIIGVTPMIGRNDVTSEVFTQQDAQLLLVFAQQKGLGRLGIWSITRDQQDPAGALAWVSATSSSILQKPFEFSQLFRPFTAWR